MLPFCFSISSNVSYSFHSLFICSGRINLSSLLCRRHHSCGNEHFVAMDLGHGDDDHVPNYHEKERGRPRPSQVWQIGCKIRDKHKNRVIFIYLFVKNTSRFDDVTERVFTRKVGSSDQLTVSCTQTYTRIISGQCWGDKNPTQAGNGLFIGHQTERARYNWS